MRVQINNFRNIEEINFEGKRIRITGRNKEGKTSIMRSLERVLFGTIGGYKRGTLPIKIGQTDCYVYAKLNGLEYERTSDSSDAFVPVRLRPIMYANLLDQEPRYIKETLAEVFLKDIIKNEFKDYDQGSLDKTLRLIRNMYIKFNREYEAIKTKILFINGQIEDNEASMMSDEEYQELYARMIELKTLEEKSGINSLMKEREYIRKDLQKQSIELENMLQDKASLLKQYENKKDEYEKLNNDKVCPLCGSNIKNTIDITTTIVKEMESIKDKGITLTNKIAILRGDIEVNNKKLDRINDDIKKLSLIEDGKLTSSKELTERVVNAKSKQQQQIKLREQQDKLLKEMIEMNDDPIIKAYEAIGPTGLLNQKLSEVINDILQGYEIRLFETSEWSSQDKAVFKIYKDGIPYKLFSRSEKVKTNILLSIAIMKISKYNMPLLIDDLEMFSTQDKKDLIKLLDNSGLEYITSEVKSTPLTIKTQ